MSLIFSLRILEIVNEPASFFQMPVDKFTELFTKP